MRSRDNNTEIGVPNELGELLFMPADLIGSLEHMPAGLLSKMTSVVTNNQRLEVVVHRDGQDEVESVTLDDKAVFCPETSSVMFPELEHGASFESDGLVTRGNENSNSIGFSYRDHILTCYPAEGSIVRLDCCSSRAGWWQDHSR